jgi:hypothetical protein
MARPVKIQCIHSSNTVFTLFISLSISGIFIFNGWSIEGRPRKEDAMGERQLAVKEWLAKNQQEMICCPYQPGNLMISKNACSKRYWTGRKEDYQDLMRGDFFHYSYKRSLSLCRACPIGKQHASASKAAKSCSRPSARNARASHGWRMQAQNSA